MSGMTIHPETCPLTLLFVGQEGKSIHYFRDRRPNQPRADRSSMTVLERAALRALVVEALAELDEAEAKS